MKKEHTVINGTKGVISLFLAILMLPFTIFVGALVNANRVNSAASIFDEALCNAANSTLGTYTPFLKKQFSACLLSNTMSKARFRQAMFKSASAVRFPTTWKSTAAR